MESSVSRRGIVATLVATAATLWATLPFASPFGINAHFPTDALPREFEIRPGDTALLVIPVDTPSALAPGASTTVVLEARLVADDGRRFGDPIRVAMTASDFAPPTLRTQPRDIFLPEGRRLALTINATSDTPLSYQWRRNSVELEDDNRVAGSQSPLLRLLGLDRSTRGHLRLRRHQRCRLSRGIHRDGHHRDPETTQSRPSPIERSDVLTPRRFQRFESQSA